MSPKKEKLFQESIKTGLEELKQGKGIAVKKAMKQLVKKYGLSQKAK